MITFVSLFLLLRQVFCAYFGYHTHVVHCVNLERRVQRKTVTRGNQNSQHMHSKSKNAEAKGKKNQQNKNEKWLTIMRLLQG